MQIDRAQEIFVRLRDLFITLPSDASNLGAEYLQEQISICRGYLNEVSMYLQELLEERTMLTVDLEAKESSFAIASDELLAGDPRVKTLPSIADRNAMINTIQSTERKVIDALRMDIRNLGHIEKVIRLRHKELDNTMSALRLQRSLLKDQIRSGAFYGDESEVGRGDPFARMNGDELDRLLDESSTSDESSAEPTEDDYLLDIDGEESSGDESTAEEDTSLEDDLDDLIDLGGSDDTPPNEPPPKREPKEGALLVPSKPPGLTEKDADPDMLEFVESPLSDDDLDDLLEDV